MCAYAAIPVTLKLKTRLMSSQKNHWPINELPAGPSARRRSRKNAPSAPKMPKIAVACDAIGFDPGVTKIVWRLQTLCVVGRYKKVSGGSKPHYRSRILSVGDIWTGESSAANFELFGNDARVSYDNMSDRTAGGHAILTAAAKPAGSDDWCAVQFWLGLLTVNSDLATSFAHFTALRDALAGHAPVPLLARALAMRAGDLANLGRLPEAAEEGRRALAMARELGDRPGEACALFWLSATAFYPGDFHGCVAWLRQVR